MKHLVIREEKKPEDLSQQWGGQTCWSVRDAEGGVPVASFNSEKSALNFVVREQFRRAP